jgi:hypothetical protein
MDSKTVNVTVHVNSLEAFLIHVVKQGERERVLEVVISPCIGH